MAALTLLELAVYDCRQRGEKEKMKPNWLTKIIKLSRKYAWLHPLRKK